MYAAALEWGDVSRDQMWARVEVDIWALGEGWSWKAGEKDRKRFYGREREEGMECEGIS